jgi:2-polyprenyl-6-methoxyphenol hydroxylase-like FAD-dependent oxidoreductase
LKAVRGQGLNHCILDASNLIEAVNRIRSADSTREAEIASYEKELIDRGAEEVNLSVETALTVHNWPQFMESPLMKHGVTKMS